MTITGPPWFSDIDLRETNNFVQTFGRTAYLSPPHGALVLSRDFIIWPLLMPGRKKTASNFWLQCHWISNDVNSRVIMTDWLLRRVSLARRATKFFPNAGAVIGLGGGGSHIVQQLAQGRNFLVDPDLWKKTNLKIVWWEQRIRTTLRQRAETTVSRRLISRQQPNRLRSPSSQRMAGGRSFGRRLRS